MARIRPFAGWRYSSGQADISPLIAPPYDVVSPEQRAELLGQDEHNAVALELPDGPLDLLAAGNRYATGRETWDAWRSSGVLKRDDSPNIYVLEQSYTLGSRPVTRRAFIVEVGLEPFSAGVVLPHERTLPKALGDRFELIKATGANFSQVFGLYDDPACLSNTLFDAVMSTEPIETAVDAEGVVSTLWASQSMELAADLAQLLADKQVFIADGHHRYTTALAYRDECRKTSPAAEKDPDYDFVMMALVNMDDPDLIVLPTHRVADAPEEFDADSFKSGLAEYFELSELAPGHPSGVLNSLERPGFLVKTRADERPFLAVLRPEVAIESAIAVDASSAWKHLDVAILQELVLSPLLDIHPNRAQTLERLSFVKDGHDALRSVGDHDVAFILRATKMSQLRAVALAGEIMPQKSTYFYPKLPTGLVFRSAD